MNRMFIGIAVISCFIGGCALSAGDQSRLDRFPECKEEKPRLNTSLSRSEFTCLAMKERELKYQNQMEAITAENNKLRQKSEAEWALHEERRKAYESSPQGIKDKSTCRSLLEQSLTGIAYSQIENMGFSKSDDGFLTCSALIHYQSAFGIQVRPRIVIFNEQNKMMNIYDR
ncbi:hypothetical protein PY479_17385 [Shewanella sp. A32]|uniref:hypothetical protein n=1 Tax=Shewanella sp. A32 TaxID=3031327 RepID=UPI0023B9F82A|nr:hypothetical protein [Shewanella sp. A32]MDF0536034.1 hypothetical protein [Shewanella sp. A32]